MIAQFRFKLGEKVVLIISGEKGVVVGRYQYDYGENKYLIRYKNALGVGVEVWWPGSALMGEVAPQ